MYAASAIQNMEIAGNAVRLQDVAELTEELRKFPALTCLDVSSNPELGDVGVAAILSSLSGTRIPALCYVY
jgi:hypothetical protein